MSDTKMFRTESGDLYVIPAEQYERDVKSYREAVSRGDEGGMLHYEEGRTGWRMAKENL